MVPVAPLPVGDLLKPKKNYQLIVLMIIIIMIILGIIIIIIITQNITIVIIKTIIGIFLSS